MSDPRAATRASERTPLWVWPALGILALLIFNAEADAFGARHAGLFGPGSFLGLRWSDGVPSGAIVDIVNYGAAIAILALGMTPVVAVRGVDISVGSVMAICGCAAAELVRDGHTSGLAISIAILLGVACGVWNGVLVAVLRVQPFVATLILMACGRGIAQMITGGQIATFHDPVLEFIGLGRSVWFPVPFPFVLGVLLLVVTATGLRRTALGLLVEAVGGNPVASRLAGVRSRSLTIGAYAFCGFCASIAGLIAVANIKAGDPFNTGRNSELGAIFAVVVGGTPLTGGRFSLVGSFVGALLVQCLTTTMYARDVGSDVAPLPIAGVILAVCIAGSPALKALFKRRVRA